jgi:folate-binding protein YgfZ
MIRLTHRALMHVGGPDATKFLQGLITQDMNRLATSSHAESAIAACLLSPRGRVLFDLIVYRHDGYLLECDASLVDKLKRVLQIYVLKSKVEISSVTDLSVFHNIHTTTSTTLNSSSSFEHVVTSVDPRFDPLGTRIVSASSTSSLSTSNSSAVPSTEESNASLDVYHAHRIQCGIPEGVSDLLYDESTPLECNLDLLNAVAFNKGCYLGQELTARTHFTGVIRKRLLPVSFLGSEECPPVGSAVMKEGKVVGRIGSTAHLPASSGNQETKSGIGIALLRMEHAFPQGAPSDRNQSLSAAPTDLEVESAGRKWGLVAHWPDWLPRE